MSEELRETPSLLTTAATICLLGLPVVALVVRIATAGWMFAFFMMSIVGPILAAAAYVLTVWGVVRTLHDPGVGRAVTRRDVFGIVAAVVLLLGVVSFPDATDAGSSTGLSLSVAATDALSVVSIVLSVVGFAFWGAWLTLALRQTRKG